MLFGSGAFWGLMDISNLTERETLVLESVVRNYILNAAPTGSRFVSKSGGLELSPATIRNVMGDLEDKGLIASPHTSSGRIPTDSGYRYYVDRMMESVILPLTVISQIRAELTDLDSSDLHIVMEAASRALSRATNHLGIILAPQLSDGIFRHIHIYPIGSRRHVIHITIDSGFVKTLVVEIETSIDPASIESACRIINERFYGFTLRDMFLNGKTAFSDVTNLELGIIRLFVPAIQKIMERNTSLDVLTNGTSRLLLKPDFADRDAMSTILEILDEKNLLMHILSDGETATSKTAIVSIGGEISEGRFNSFSVVKTGYAIGSLSGCLGVIGPKRMPYPYLVAAVEYTASALEELYSGQF